MKKSLKQIIAGIIFGVVSFYGGMVLAGYRHPTDGSLSQEVIAGAVILAAILAVFWAVQIILNP